jgi:hypothetical protein
MFTLVNCDLSTDEDGNLVAVLTLASEITEEAAANLIPLVGQEVNLTAQ